MTTKHEVNVQLPERLEYYWDEKGLGTFEVFYSEGKPKNKHPELQEVINDMGKILKANPNLKISEGPTPYQTNSLFSKKTISFIVRFEAMTLV